MNKNEQMKMFYDEIEGGGEWSNTSKIDGIKF